MQTIVVGVDGSPGSRRALRWAAEEAKAHNAQLQAVMAWEYQIFGALPGDQIGLPDEDQGPEMLGILEGIVNAELGPDAENIELRPVYGSPSEAILSASADADLLVLGTRGLGGFKRLVLGSVSSQVAHHAHVPVVIVPPPEEQPEEGGPDEAES